MTQAWAVIAQKGGAGKTTLSLHIAIALTQMARTVELIDVDPQASAYKWSLQRKDKPPRVTPIVAAQIYDVLDQIRHRGTEVAIVDTSPRADRESLIIANAADFIIVPVRPSPLDFPAVNETLDLLHRAGQLEKAVLLLNAVAASTDEGEMAMGYMKKLGPTVCPHWISERVDFRRSLLLGQGITEAKKKSAAVKEIGLVTKWLVKQADTTQEAKNGGKGRSVRKAS